MNRSRIFITGKTHKSKLFYLKIWYNRYINMSETPIPESKLVKSVEISGDKNGFNSKSAIDKFKQVVKTLNTVDPVDLGKKFLKNGYELILENNTESSEYKFMVKQSTQSTQSVVSSPVDNNVNINSDKDRVRELLKAKINNMGQLRTNSNYHKAKLSSNVPDEILSEYKKLLKISKMPVPEPSEILANPDQHRSIVSMVLGNNLMKNLPQTHPYVKYFKLIAKQIGATEKLPVPTQNFLNNQMDVSSLPNNLEQMMKMAGPVTEVKGNELGMDESTDTEEESN